MSEQRHGARRPEDVPEGDAFEQERSWDDSEDDEDQEPNVGLDVPEADALEQARPVPLDEEQEPR